MLTLQELADLVRRMRKCQRDYFRDRRPSDLNASRDLERRVDAVLKELADQQGPGLFGETSERR